MKLTMGDLDRVTRYLSDASGIRVVFGGNPCTNKKTIQLPFMDISKLTPEQLSRLRGYLDHEGQHCYSTDFEEMFNRLHSASPLKEHLYQAMEDLRTERLGSLRGKGHARNLREMNKLLRKDWIAKRDSGEPIKPVFKFLYDSYLDVINLDPVFKHSRKEQKLMRDIVSRMKKAQKCPSTKEALNYGDSIFKLLADYEEQEQKQKQSSGQQGKPKAQRTQKGNGKSAKARGDQDVDGGKPADDPGESGDRDRPGHADVDEHPEQGRGTDPDSVPGSGTPEQAPPQPPEGIEDILGVTSGDLENIPDNQKAIQEMGQTYQESPDINDRYLIWTKLYDEEIVPPPLLEAVAELQEADLNLSAISARMRSLLLSVAKSKTLRDQEEGKFDRAKLPYLAVNPGHHPLYTRKIEGIKINTAFHIVADLSGSFDESKVRDSARALLHLGEAIGGVNLPLEVVWTTTKVSEGQHDWNLAGRPVRFHRVNAMVRVIIKRYGESIQQIRGRIGRVAASLGGIHVPNVPYYNLPQNNCFDAENLVYGAQSLMARPEKRKVLIMLTDFQTACPTGHETYRQKELLRPLAKQILADGIDLIVLSIGSYFTRSYWLPSDRVIAPSGGVGVQMFKEIVKRLEDDQRAHLSRR